MKRIIILMLITIFFSLVISSCSGGKGNPVIPADNQNPGIISPGENSPVAGSDVLYSSATRDLYAYKAFGAYSVRIDPVTLAGEIIPSRYAGGVGLTFDADLTQFLTAQLCHNCLQIDGIESLGSNQIQVGFAVKHPFPVLTVRPDLHGFDVRGIVIAKGNYNFPHVLVNLTDTSTQPARANSTLIANADGYTHHFDELAADTHYFDPPHTYDATINPFKRYFVDGSTGGFIASSPSGHNVIPVGSAFETQDFIFNAPAGGGTIDFVFIVDCAYGQSATLANRTNPYYFLPEFNRKEAWKADVTIVTNNLQSGVVASSAQIKVEVCDWQAGLTADPNYPNPGNLGGISVKSDVKSVELEVPFVNNTLLSVTNPVSGNGSFDSPYVFNLSVSNLQGASAGTYTGLIAVRDDLQGLKGPMAIPAGPNTFPGVEIYDYSVYQLFSIRVKGTAPVVNTITPPADIFENSMVTLNANVTEPDGDAVAYSWEQVTPATPRVTFVNPAVKNAQIVLPDLFDVPLAGIEFTLKLTATDVDGAGSKQASFFVKERNSAPTCARIESVPFLGIVQAGQSVNLTALAWDPDGDDIIIQWDFNYNGVTFDVDDTGTNVSKYWMAAGFYNVACRVTEDRTNALQSMCTRIFIVKGVYNADIKVDDSSDADPNYYRPDIAYVDGVAHAAWLDKDNYDIIYGNNATSHDVFGNYGYFAQGPDHGWITSPKIAGSPGNLMVVWAEYNSDAPATYSLKICRSNDGGRNWLLPQTITTRLSPDTLDDVAIGNGTSDLEFYIFYEAKETAQIKNYCLRSVNGGLTWSATPGVQFRDTFGVGDFVSNLFIKESSNNILYAYWLDGYMSPAPYLMDWSADNGMTWNTDTTINSTTNLIQDCSDMCFDALGNAYFLSMEDDDVLVLKKAIFSTFPQVSQMYALGISPFNSCNLYVSPTARVIVMAYARSNQLNMHYTLNGGTGWGSNSTSINHSSGMVYDVTVDGIWNDSPDRDELFFAWVDNRSAAGTEAHIYGNFLYVAEQY